MHTPLIWVGLGGAGGLAVRVAITKQIAMGWQGLTSRAVKKKVTPPYYQHTALAD